VYQTEAAPPAIISVPREMMALIGAPVTGRAWPALTPPLGVGVTPPWMVTLGLTPVGGTVSTLPVGVVLPGVGVGLVVAGVVPGGVVVTVP
jgi:hypothetical protein